MIKIVLQILFLFAPALAIGQCHHNAKRVDLGITQSTPMRDAKVYFTDPGCSFYGCRMPGVDIESNSDSVFSNSYGKVSAIFDLGDYKCVILRDDKNIFYTFTQLISVAVKKGEVIIKGAYLGAAGKEKDSKESYSIIYMITDKNAKNFSEENIWESLKNSDHLECSNNEVSYQSVKDN